MARDMPAGKEGGGSVISRKWGSWAKGHHGRPASQTGQPETALGGRVTWQQAVDIQLLGLGSGVLKKFLADLVLIGNIKATEGMGADSVTHY